MSLSIADLEDQVCAALAAEGIAYRGPINADGEIHRVGAKGDPRGSQPVWYIIYNDAYPAGKFGCHKRRNGESFLWKANYTKPLSAADRQKLMAQSSENGRRRQAEKVKRWDAAAKNAVHIWDGAKPASDTHPYLARKQVKSYGLRITDWELPMSYHPPLIPGALIVPVRDARGRLSSLQAIFPDDKNPLRRTKTFLTNGAKAGCCFPIGRPTKVGDDYVVVVCEGYATGASIHEATGLCTAVAFDAGNLVAVAQRIRARLANAEILVAADNDRWTTGANTNPGVTKAREAAESVGGLVAVPEFIDLSGKPTDFNDLHAGEGLAAVRDQVLASVLRFGP